MPGAGDPESPAQSSTPPPLQQRLAILYRFEGSDARRLVRTWWPGSTVALEELRGMIASDGVDVQQWRSRIFDEHFQGWLVSMHRLDVGTQTRSRARP